MTEARAARADWERFPGFTAAVEVNRNGTVSRGKVRVDARGKVALEGLDQEAEAWAKPTLASIVSHRLAGPADETPCAFTGDDGNHPLGREIVTLVDGARFRIRDRQILVVDRTMGGQRFVITVLENRTTPEGKFLPASFVVTYWDTKNGQVTKNVATAQTWTRVGGFDLPANSRITTATPFSTGGQPYSADSLTLAEHKLMDTAAGK
jgi:hypothetical protein